MTVATYILGVVSALITLAVVVEMLRRRRLRERHAVWWIVAGTLALVIGVFPSTLIWAARLIGVAVPVNLVFFVSAAVLFLVCIQHSSELTALEEKTRLLAETAALQQMRIEQLEKRLIGHATPLLESVPVDENRPPEH
ncbi:MAG: DUF2304 domain-containing protein [Salinibacterium sp.]|nr:DUF2304 domain-containing protein [Salinibacterium sp.]